MDIKIIGCQATEGSLLLPGLVGICFGKYLVCIYLFQPERERTIAASPGHRNHCSLLP